MAQVDCTGGVRLDDHCWHTHYVLYQMTLQVGGSGILADGIMIGWVMTGGFIIDGFIFNKVFTCSSDRAIVAGVFDNGVWTDGVINGEATIYAFLMRKYTHHHYS